MSAIESSTNRRVLIVDDNPDIQCVLRRILAPTSSESDAEQASVTRFCVESVETGEAALASVRQSLVKDAPFALAFIDIELGVRWSGFETIERLWNVDPELQVVICTGSPGSIWQEISQRFGSTDQLLVLNKPFEVPEIRQLAYALTEKWNLSRKAHREREQLDALVRERTRELADAKHAAEAANRAKSEFLTNMSHEIRTPMTAILGFTETLLSPDLSEDEHASAVGRIHRNGKYLLEILDDILDLSKIESGRLALHKGRFSPIQLMADVASMMRIRADAKNLSLDIEFDGPIPETIRSDQTRLRQILVNLVGNAIKFTEQGGARIMTRFDAGSNGSAVLEIDVIDTGIGMTEEQSRKLFLPFQQADNSLTREYGGAGLGLSISLRLAEMLDGQLSAHCTENDGCTFRTRIPVGSLEGIRMVENASEASFATPDQWAPAKNSGKQLNCRVLLAEDGPDNQRLISFLLKKAGADVTVVENGELAVKEALKAERINKPFGVILMDMQMPVLDGYSATSTLRRRGYAKPIIALTAHVMTGDREKCLRAGCDEYVAKPVDRKQLVSLVAEWAKRSQSRDSSEPEIDEERDGVCLLKKM